MAVNNLELAIKSAQSALGNMIYSNSNCSFEDKINKLADAGIALKLAEDQLHTAMADLINETVSL